MYTPLWIEMLSKIRIALIQSVYGYDVRKVSLIYRKVILGLKNFDLITNNNNDNNFLPHIDFSVFGMVNCESIVPLDFVRLITISFGG